MRTLTPLVLRVTRGSHAESTVLCRVCWPAPCNMMLQLYNLVSQKWLEILVFRLVWQYGHAGLSQNSLVTPVLAWSRGTTQAQVGKIRRSKPAATGNEDAAGSRGTELWTLAQTSLISRVKNSLWDWYFVSHSLCGLPLILLTFSLLSGCRVSWTSLPLEQKTDSSKARPKKKKKKMMQNNNWNTVSELN